MFLTMLPTLVTASPIPSLTRDNNVAKENDGKSSETQLKPSFKNEKTAVSGLA